MTWGLAIITLDNNIHQLMYCLCEAYRSIPSQQIASRQLVLQPESYLYDLSFRIAKGYYKPSLPLVFPVARQKITREVFALSFEDKLVEKVLYNTIAPYIAPCLIFDNYSRKDKGVHFGINRAQRFIRSCSDNYRRDTWILKLDVASYFMTINQALLYKKMLKLLAPKSNEMALSYDLVKKLLRVCIFKNYKQSHFIKGSDYLGLLPFGKSLFHQSLGIGIASGSVMSQCFGNVYLNDLDHELKSIQKLPYYGRYADDMIFVSKDKEVLKSVISIVREKLTKEGLTLHPGKVYLQHYSKGVLFLGRYIKPWRTYVGPKSKNGFVQSISKINGLLASPSIDTKQLEYIQQLLNSYLGNLSHANSYDLVKKYMLNLSDEFHFYFSVSTSYKKVLLRKPVELYDRLYFFTYLQK